MKLNGQEKRQLFFGTILIAGILLPMLPTVIKIYGLPDMLIAICSYAGVSVGK